MAALDDFPPETLRNIFSSLSQADIASASLVSRRWQAISEPILYQEPILKQQYSTSFFGPRPHGLELLLRTFLAPGCGRLASHVREIYVRWCRSIVDLTPARRSTLSIIAAAESRFGVPHSSVYGSPDSQVVLLMHLLPRLRGLVLGFPDERDSFDDFLDTIGPAHPPPLAFQSLETFCSDSYGLRPGVVLALLQLPCLHTLEIQVHGQFDGPFPADVHGTSCVTALSLWSGDISAALLDFLLSVPSALEKLAYHGPCMVGFVDVLWQLRATLTDLHIGFGDTENPPASAHSLRAWPVLRDVACPLELLVGCVGAPLGWQLAERLPVCIQVLRIVNWECGSDEDWSAEHAVQDLVQLVSGGMPMVPSLRSLMVDRDSWVCWVSQEVQGVLRAACEGAGVALMFRFPV